MLGREDRLLSFGGGIGRRRIVELERIDSLSTDRGVVTSGVRTGRGSGSEGSSGTAS